MCYIDDRPSDEELQSEIARLELEHFGHRLCWPDDERPLYVTAKRPRIPGERTGSIAWKTTGGKDTAALVLRLSHEYPGISIMTIFPHGISREQLPYLKKMFAA